MQAFGSYLQCVLACHQAHLELFLRDRPAEKQY